VDLREGREGFDFLGCHFHARVSGRLLERGIRRYYLHRWPSARSMVRVRQRVKELTGRNRNGVTDVRVLILDINPILRGWGNYFRTGNAADKFRQIDWYVMGRLRRFVERDLGTERGEIIADKIARYRGFFSRRPDVHATVGFVVNAPGRARSIVALAERDRSLAPNLLVAMTLDREVLADPFGSIWRGSETACATAALPSALASGALELLGPGHVADGGR
jgi:Group II intron, maturase-specific domain